MTYARLYQSHKRLPKNTPNVAPNNIVQNMLFFPFQNWCFNCFCNTPSGTKSFIKGVSVNTDFLRPFRYCKIKATIFNSSVRPSIGHLLFSCGPAAVIAAVIPVAINSLKCHFFGRMPHIFKEIRKAKPFITDFDSASTVIRVKLRSGICTSLFHGTPNIVCSGVARIMSFVSDMQGTSAVRRFFISQTSARGYFTSLKMVAPYLLFCTTGACTDKITPVSNLINCKPSKNITYRNRVNLFSRHNSDLLYEITLNPNIKDVNYGF